MKDAISMAALQGHLLRHKLSFNSALESLSTLQQELSQQAPSPALINNKEEAIVMQKMQVRQAVKPRPVKAMTAEQVDKMFFNPQKDWDRS